MTVYFLMAVLLILKFGSDRIKTVGGVAFWNVQSQYGHVLTKNSKCHKILILAECQKYNLLFPHY